LDKVKCTGLFPAGDGVDGDEQIPILEQFVREVQPADPDVSHEHVSWRTTVRQCTAVHWINAISTALH
jgi:hypothetical protein